MVGGGARFGCLFFLNLFSFFVSLFFLFSFFSSAVCLIGCVSQNPQPHIHVLGKRKTLLAGNQVIVFVRTRPETICSSDGTDPAVDLRQSVTVIVQTQQ